MKKVLYILVLVLSIMFPFKVLAGDSDSFVNWNLDKTIFAHQYRNNEDHITNLAMFDVNGVISYCIEPGIVADNESYYSSTTNISDTKLKNVDIKRLSLIGYYGYGYKDHTDKKYYMAAQELIWRLMGVSDVWWTDAKYNGNIINVDYYKNEILKLVDSYEVAPKINLKKTYIVGDEVILEDLNNSLNDFDVVGNNDVSISNNKIKINIKEKDNSFILRRKTNGKTTKFYYKDGYQTLGSFEYPYSFEKKYTTNYTYAKIIIDKKDYDTKSKKLSSKYASLEGAIYGLYDSNDKLIKTKKTDENGKIIFDRLSKGEYRVKEIKPSKGYTLSNSLTRVFINSYNLETTVNSYERIIKNKIVIIKMLDDIENDISIKEEGIKFNIYDIDGNLIKEEVTNIDGEIIVELPYGKYIIKQVSTLDGIDIVDNKEITIDENNITQNIVLINHRLPKEEKEEEKEEDNSEPIIIKEELPNTGNNNLLYGILSLSLVSMGFIYEKKHI